MSTRMIVPPSSTSTDGRRVGQIHFRRLATSNGGNGTTGGNGGA